MPFLLGIFQAGQSRPLLQWLLLIQRVKLAFLPSKLDLTDTPKQPWMVPQCNLGELGQPWGPGVTLFISLELVDPCVYWRKYGVHPCRTSLLVNVSRSDQGLQGEIGPSWGILSSH